jgi:pyocin large subunit-like protein
VLLLLLIGLLVLPVAWARRVCSRQRLLGWATLAAALGLSVAACRGSSSTQDSDRSQVQPAQVPPELAAAAEGQGQGASTWGRPSTLLDHFRRHGSDFNARSPDEYARLASDFFRRLHRERLPTKIDEAGVIRVYDPRTNTFGAYNPDGTTRTFFKPKREYAYWAQQPGISPWKP